MKKFSKILIANRGEIAVRVCRTAKAMGYRTVAVYSEADANALHVKAADQAVCIGPPPVGQSYLSADRILDAMEKTGADAVHPGYGFLSENAYFARACVDSGYTFIGPNPEAIMIMGNKRAAKEKMQGTKVPCVPGYEGTDQSDARFLKEAEALGFPVMIKAAAGGGGRGMRLVHQPAEFQAALRTARSEALTAFGSDEIILEKAIIEPRHIEIQVFADQQGNTIYLGERDCSIQRRHQKIVEEAPSPFVDEKLRKKMGKAAVEAAKTVHYLGAGTVEFLVDQDKNFYFLEMNTRLQVEHPVTEMVTGLDLVELQLRVAAGQPLGITQENVTLTGHAIEVRLYAEDPAQDFLPQTGPILAWTPPRGQGVRADYGIQTGQAVSAFYDPMLAKLIASGSDREEARRRLSRAVSDCVFLGIPSNKKFLADILNHPAFMEGAATTAFIPTFYPKDTLAITTPLPRHLALAAAIFHQESAESVQPVPWFRNWSASHPRTIQYRLAASDEKEYSVLLDSTQPECFSISANGAKFEITLLAKDRGKQRYSCNGIQETAAYVLKDNRLYLNLDGGQVLFENRTLAEKGSEAKAGKGHLKAVMDGRIVAVHATEGDRVEAGQTLVVLDAMKIEHQIKTDIAGTVKSVLVHTNQQVKSRQMLIEVEGES